MPDVTERPLADRARFKTWTTEKLRYCDTDRQGHINNAVFVEMLEAGRVHLLFEPGAPTAPPGCAFVIARLELDFLGEMGWPGTVDVGSVVLSIGRSSFRLGQGIFFNGACVGTAEAVLVLMDESTRRAAPLPDDFRARLESLKLD